MKHLILLLLDMSFFCLTVSAQSDKRDSLAIDNIYKQLLLYPQEKLYVQTDKPYYISGEKLFYRIFMLDACRHAKNGRNWVSKNGHIGSIF